MHSHQLKWMQVTLLAAAAYNIVWGSWVVLFPEALFYILGIESPRYLPIWQAVGMIVGVYGIGYGIAAFAPMRHWPIVLVGLLGKILGPIGLVISVYQGHLPASFFWQILFNDLIWWIPFSLILLNVTRYYSAPEYVRRKWESSQDEPDSWEHTVDAFQSQMGLTIREISDQRPLMLIFLRQAGCTFCRRNLADLQQNRDKILGLGIEMAIVHQGSPMEGTVMLSNYDLDFFHRFSDPDCDLYRHFGFRRGSLSEVVSLKILFRGLKTAWFGGHGIGSVKGDSFQLPGVIVVFKGEVVLALPAEEASEQFDYLEIAQRAATIHRKYQILEPHAQTVSLKS